MYTYRNRVSTTKDNVKQICQLTNWGTLNPTKCQHEIRWSGKITDMTFKKEYAFLELQLKATSEFVYAKR